MADKKPLLNVALLGHVDCGKSTLAGHLLFLTGHVAAVELERHAELANSIGKASFKFAFIMDRAKSERERGITIDSTSRPLETRKRTYHIIDCPGHRDFTKNAITGMSGADVALLVVASGIGEFEAGMEYGGTSDHATLAFAAGVRDVVVAVSKMDSPGVEFSEARFIEVREAVLSMLRKVGFAEANVTFVPCSAWFGYNLVDDGFAEDGNAGAREKMPWYEGPSVLTALDELPARLTDRARLIDEPLRMPVANVFRIGGIGTVVTGIVAAGRVRRGMTATFSPAGVSGVVRCIEKFHHATEEAGPGDAVGINVAGLSRSQVRRGMVCGDADSEHAPSCAVKFEAQVVVLSHPGEVRRGYCPVVDCGTAHVACTVTEIGARMDRATGAVLEEHPISIKQGDAAMLTLVPTKPLCVEAYMDCKQLGAFTIRDLHTVVAAGIVRTVQKSEDR